MAKNQGRAKPYNACMLLAVCDLIVQGSITRNQIPFDDVLKKLIKRSRNDLLGFDGEEYTGQELNLLMRSGAWVYHDISYDYGNIDHIVISTGGVFSVETKAVRKPADQKGARQSKVTLVDGKLSFPHVTTAYPVKQEKRHAEYVRQFLKRKTGNEYPVTPVVALPGWFVERKGNNDVLVINPKRGRALHSRVEAELVSEKEAEIIANHFDEVARSVGSFADKSDPDAHEKYDFWLNRKIDERKL